jgi:hypothetical protein
MVEKEAQKGVIINMKNQKIIENLVNIQKEVMKDTMIDMGIMKEIGVEGEDWEEEGG